MAEVLRSGDVAVALRLVSQPLEGYESLSDALGIGTGSAHRAVKRLQKAQLVTPDRRIVLRRHLEEFVVHGLRFSFYAVPRAETLGVPTAELPEFVGDQRTFVWPAAQGTRRGTGIAPLLPQAVELPERDPATYRALSLIDALRVGGARERKAAAGLFKDWLEEHGDAEG